MFKVRSLAGGVVVLALCLGFTTSCGSSDSARTKNAALVAGTSCAKLGRVTTIDQQRVVCANTSSGSKWYGVNKASGTPVKCSSLGELRRRANTIWVCGKDGKKIIWKATLPLPVIAAGIATTVPGATAPATPQSLESTSPNAGLPSNDVLTNTGLTDESLETAVVVAESKPWLVSASADADGAARDLTQDTKGNSYALGSFCGNHMSFGGLLITGNERGVSACSVTLSKVSATGEVQWNSVINGDGLQNWGESVVVNSTGEIFITGFFAGTKITSGDVTVSADNVGYNSFLMKFDADGVAQWGKVLGGKLTKNIKFDWSLDLSGEGANLYLVGLINGLNKTVTLGSHSVVSSSANDMFVAKLDESTGDAEWVNNYPVSTPFLKNNSVVDSSGNVYVAASFTAESLTIGTTPTTTLTNAKSGNIDAFVLKIDKLGAPLWAVRIGDDGDDEAGNIALSKNGVVMSGNFDSAQLLIGKNTLTKAGTSTGFVAHISDAGVIGASFAMANSLRLGSSDGNISEDGKGNLYLSGVFSGDFSLGAKSLSTPKDSYDAFVLKMSPTGDMLWAEQLGNSGNTGAAFVQADNAGATIFSDNGATTDVTIGSVTVKSGLVLVRVGRSDVLP
ncbi:MAG: hypothetical protein WCG49_01575 [Actinomycetes bacterium]